MNILTKETWETMGKKNLFWSPVQLHLENKAKVSHIGQVSHRPVEVEGLKTYAFLYVIEIVKNTNPYPSLLGVDSKMENLAVINFKKITMMFWNHDTRVISPLDPLEGK